MNQADRKRVGELVAQLEALKEAVASVGEELENLANDEQSKFDNMNEGLQQSEQGQSIENAAQQLEEAASNCESGDIQGAIDALGELQ